MPGKLLNGYETLLVVPAVEINGVPWMVTPTGLVDYEAPTAAALNVFQAINQPSDAYASQGGNISCAVLDDMNLGLASSDPSDTNTLCSKGNTEALTFFNFNAEVSVLRDEDIDGDGVFNLARDLFRAPDVAYFLVHRVRGGKDSTETFAAGDEVDIYYVWTDNPVPVFGDGEEQAISMSFIQKSIVNVGYELTA